MVQYPAVSNDGIVLNDVTLDKNDLNNLKEVAPYTYYSQYQQTPMIPGGNIIKLSWWRIYDPDVEVPHGLRYVTGDTAYGEHDESDPSVFQLWEATEKCLYFVDSMYGVWNFPTLLKNAGLFWRMANAKEFWVEAKASGLSLTQTLNDAPLNIPAQSWNPTDYEFPKDKVGRMQEASWLVHGGKVALPKGNVPVRVSDNLVVHVTPGAAALMEEAAAFAMDMSHMHDDHCDTFTMAVSLYRDAGGTAV